MKIYKGFTLAEALITLGIIGVVAALSAPSLVHNAANSKIGPSLSKFRTTFEVGSNMMMAKMNLERFHKEELGSEIANLNKYIKMIPYSENYSFKDAKGNNTYTNRSKEYYEKLLANYENSCSGVGVIFAQGQPFTNSERSDCLRTKQLLDQSFAGTIFQLNNGEIMVLIPTDKYTELFDKGSYKGILAEVLIDIDGNKRENKAGKDVFAFLLDANGSLIAAGSGAHKYINQKGSKYITSFSDECNLNTESLVSNFACTGKIADNNWSTTDLDL